MADILELRKAVVSQGMKEHSLNLIDLTQDAYEYAIRLTNAKNGATDLAWGRILYGLADTGNATLTVDATLKRISCIAGAGLFANYTPGRDAQLTNFTNAGNNQTTEITAYINADTVEIASATGLVDETDTNARVQENPTQPELDYVNKVNQFITDATTMNTALGTVKANLMDNIW